MIYVIESSRIPSVISSGSVLVILSSDSQKAMITSSNEITDALETYDEEVLQDLLSLPEWKQPCKDCEV